jgi:sodium/proline symporter
MVVGAITIFVWKFLVRPNVPALDFYELLPAFILALITIFIVSLATKAPEKEIVDEFNSVKKEMHAK